MDDGFMPVLIVAIVFSFVSFGCLYQISHWAAKKRSRTAAEWKYRSEGESPWVRGTYSGARTHRHQQEF